MVKIALDAGHGLYTGGKRCLKSIDPKETREWVLNNRVLTNLQNLLTEYKDVEVMRVDDPTGKVDVSLFERVRKANNWKADIYLSDHKNAGINGGSGGGLVVYKSTYAGEESTRFQPMLYKHLLNATGLKGNRANPTPAAQFYVIYRTNMPALLIEGGYMDSLVDTPIILTEAYAKKMAQGYMNFLVEAFNLKKKNAFEILVEDGILGERTIRRLQQYLGTPQDGIISTPSSMVKELQKRLNNNKL